LMDVAQGYLIKSPTGGLANKLAREVIGVNINVFDLYRRVGRLEEARELGERTLDDAIHLGDSPITLRAGNFLTLVGSAEAYQSLERKDYSRALQLHKKIEDAFESMPLKEAEGKNAVMLHSNRSANYLNIVRVAKIGDLDYEASNTLDDAYASSQVAYSFLKELGDKDMGNWAANIYANYGFIEDCRGDNELAVEHYQKALGWSSEADFSALTAGIQFSLAKLLVDSSPEKAKEHFTPVEEFLKTNSFGIYDTHVLPLLDEVREKLSI